MNGSTTDHYFQQRSFETTRFEERSRRPHTDLFEAPSPDAEIRDAAIASVIEGVPAAFEGRANEL